jgi:hypothetical protein
VARKAGQLAVRGVAHLLPQTVGTVVQDDLHSLSIRRRRVSSRLINGWLACTPGEAETAS